MIAVSGGIVWAGFGLMWWGWTRVRGCPATWPELVIPGRYRSCGTTVDNSTTPTYGVGKDGKPTNPAYPGEAPGWRPPMAPGYVPTAPGTSGGGIP